jgi:hypothetical protein
MPGRGLAHRALLLSLVLAGAGLAHGNGPHGPETGQEPVTRFERFLLTSCLPCVSTSSLVATVPIAPLRLSGFPPPVASAMARGGELRLEVVRAHPLGRASQQFLAARATLSVAAGGGQFYRFGTGLVDEEELAALAAAVSEMATFATSAAPPEDQADTTEMEFHTATLRVGVMRTQATVVAYVQSARDIHALAPTAPWETQSVLFLGPGDLPTLRQAIDQVAARIKTLRGERPRP